MQEVFSCSTWQEMQATLILLHCCKSHSCVACKMIANFLFLHNDVTKWRLFTNVEFFVIHHEILARVLQNSCNIVQMQQRWQWLFFKLRFTSSRTCGWIEVLISIDIQVPICAQNRSLSLRARMQFHPVLLSWKILVLFYWCLGKIYAWSKLRKSI